MYKRTHDSIAKAFISRQLVHLARELGVPALRNEPKARVIPKIMAKWGWGPPRDPPEPPKEKEENDREKPSAMVEKS
jgi:hypothetical protein